MKAKKVVDFQSVDERAGKSSLPGKTLLIPEMNRIGAHLLAATFRGFGVGARVMETYRGLDLGRDYTSGKECYPCQVTMGDILHFIEKEKEGLGNGFKPEDYIYLMPESDGPCRFGMYNKYQRTVLDSFPGLSRLRIVSPTTRDAYSLGGLLGDNQEQDFRKAAYFSIVVADVLDRLLWRVRPYEKEPGMTDDFIERSMRIMEQEFTSHGSRKAFGKILDKLEEIMREGKIIRNPDIPPKPLIGIVGEIYMRMHVQANQDLIRTLERHGAEVVNASLSEWVNYISYEGFRNAKKEFRMNLKQLRLDGMRQSLKSMISFGGDLFYKEFRQAQIYKRIKDLIDIAEDHKVAELEHTLREVDLFDFDLQTEACLSIATIIDFSRGGYNGAVNVYPFTCMPGMTTSTIVKPLLRKSRMPFLDVAYDSSIQPGREAEIRTFMYQVYQHFKKNGRENGRHP